MPRRGPLRSPHRANVDQGRVSGFAMFRRMNSPTPPRARRRALLRIVVALCVGGILFAGLNVQGWESRNDVEWATDGTGLEFGEHGLAYTDTFTTLDPGDQTGQGFTIEMVLRPSEEADRGFRFIAVVHGGDDSLQLLIAQWRQTIIVMNGDDYDHRRERYDSPPMSRMGVRGPGFSWSSQMSVVARCI